MSDKPVEIKHFAVHAYCVFECGCGQPALIIQAFNHKASCPTCGRIYGIATCTFNRDEDGKPVMNFELGEYGRIQLASSLSLN